MKTDGRLKHEAMHNKGLLCFSATQYAYNKIAHFRMNRLNINLPPVRMHCSHAGQKLFHNEENVLTSQTNV